MVRKYIKIILLLPIILIYGILIGGGLFYIIKESLGLIPNLGFYELTLQYFKEAFLLKGFTNNILYSLYIATISTIFSLFIGTIIAYLITKSTSEWVKKMMSFIVRVGIILPYLYMVFIVMLFFNKSGLISRVLYHMTLVDNTVSFPNLIFSKSGFGIILTFVLKGVPFVALLVLNVMDNISKQYEEVAVTLGSNTFQVLKRIYMPLSRDTIVWSGMVLFTYDLGSFEVPYILNSLKYQSLSVSLYSQYLSPNIKSIPVTMAMTVILFVIGVISVTSFALVTRRILRGR